MANEITLGRRGVLRLLWLAVLGILGRSHAVSNLRSTLGLRSAQDPAGPTYYVDPNGNDLADGRSPSTAWATVNKVTNAGLRPGSVVAFKAGGSWTGTQLTAQNGVIYTSFGGGAKPIVDGDAKVQCFVGDGVNGVTVAKLRLINGLDHCVQFKGSENCRVIDCDTDNSGNDNIIFIDGCNDGLVSGGTHTNPRNRLGTYIPSCIEVADDSHSITIEDVDCSGSLDISGVGLTIHAHSGEAFPTGITVRRSKFHGNAHAGVNIHTDGATLPADANIVLEDCEIYDNVDTDSVGGAQRGINISDFGSGVYPIGITFRDCRIYGNAGVAVAVEGDDVSFERSLVACPGQGVLIENAKGVRFDFCTIHQFNTGSGSVLRATGSRCQDLGWGNCIWSTDLTGVVMLQMLADTGNGFTADYNLYKNSQSRAASSHWHFEGTSYDFVNWQAQTGQDAASFVDDPDFTDAASGDFTLKAGSPAIGTAEDGSDLGAPQMR